MKTYLITETNEPLKEGCLTQYGVLKSYSKDRFFNIIGQGPEKDIWIDDLKHLKCYDLTDTSFPLDTGKDWVEITDPSELQRIWEERRGPEPNGYDFKTGPEYFDRLNEWGNFTLEPCEQR